MMRVSSGMMIGKYLNQINASYANQAKLMEQSDGSNLHRPSDNSVKYSRYLGYQNRNTENLQYQDNVKAGASWMKTADSVMVNMTDIYTTLKEKTVDAANDTNNDSDLITAISKEFKAKLYEIVSLGNNQQGDRYLFAGQSDLTQPFQISTDYKDRGLTKTLDDPQSRFFKNPKDTKNLNADDTGNLTQFLELNDTDGNRYFVNTQNGKIYTEDFVQTGYKDKLKENIEHVQEGDEFATLPFFDTDALNVAGYFENTGVIRTEGTVTITRSDGTTVEQTLEYGDFIKDFTSDVYDNDGNLIKEADTAVASVPVYIKNGDGDIRVVAKGNEIKFQEGEAIAFIGVPLNATTYQTGTVVSLGCSINYPAVESVMKFDKGATYTLDTYEGAKADADVEVTDSSGNVSVVKAGEDIPQGSTIKFLTSNTGILRDPKLVNDGTGLKQDAAYLNSLLTSHSDYFDDTSIIADVDVTFEYEHTYAAGGTTTTYYTTYVVPAGSELNSYLNNTTALGTYKDIKIGSFPYTGTAPNTDTTAFDNGTSGTANVTIYFHNRLTSEEMETGEPVTFPTTTTAATSMDDLTTKLSALPAQTSFISVDAPVTVRKWDADKGGYYYQAFEAGENLMEVLPIATGEEVKAGIATTDPDKYNAYTPSTTTESLTITSYGATTLPSADVMIKNKNGDARLVQAGNPIILGEGEQEAIILGKPQDSYHFSNFVTIKQPIVTYQGDPKYISMVKLNGTVDQTADTVNTTGQDLNGSDIFDDVNSGNQTQLMSDGRLCYASSGTAMINDMFTVCAKLEHGDRKWMRTDGITIADMAHEVVTMTQSSSAARQNVYDSVSQMLTKQSEGITQDINDVSGTDIAELAVKLMQAQTIYNMSLSVGSRILPPSLADYL